MYVVALMPGCVCQIWKLQVRSLWVSLDYAGYSGPPGAAVALLSISIVGLSWFLVLIFGRVQSVLQCRHAPEDGAETCL